MMLRKLLVVLVFAAAPAALPRAASGQEYRTWTDITGEHEMEALLIDVRDGYAHMNRADGKIVRTPVAKLSQSDQVLLKRLIALRKKAGLLNLDEQGKPENESSQEPNAAGRKGFFFFEDFSDVQPGHLPEGWRSEKLLVRELPRGKKAATNFEEQEVHKVNVGNVEFPEDFVFEWVIVTHSQDGHSTGVSYDMTLGNVTVRLYVAPRYLPGDGATLSINGTKAKLDSSAVTNATVKIAVEKSGSVFRVLVDDKEVLLSRYESYNHGEGFTFTAKGSDEEYRFAILQVAGKPSSP